MAERRNYYEIINDLKIKPLPFDSSLPAPPDKIIQAAIEQWNYLSKLQGSISNESANSAQRRQELDMYEEIKLCFRDSKTRKVEADEMMKKQLENLKSKISTIYLLPPLLWRISITLSGYYLLNLTRLVPGLRREGIYMFWQHIMIFWPPRSSPIQK